jgi:hypothetical protein
VQSECKADDGFISPADSEDVLLDGFIRLFKNLQPYNYEEEAYIGIRQKTFFVQDDIGMVLL